MQLHIRCVRTSAFLPKDFFAGSLPAVLIALLAGLCPTFVRAQDLQISYGTKGIQTLSYKGIVLENAASFPSDTFHIWHMQATDLSGNVMSAGQYGWGENNNAEIWNPATNTETYSFTWGSISTQFVQNGDNLDMIVTEVNNGGSGIIFEGAEIFPFALHFPQDPAGFSGYSQYAITTTDPGVSVADFGSGVVTSVIPNESIPTYGGWKNAGTNTYTPNLTTTAPEGLATFYPHNNDPVAPGSTLTYTVSLRFTPEGTVASASDAYQSFASSYPSRMTWSDKRILGTAYVASSPPGGGDITQPGGFPTNPRRYFNDPSVDVTTAAGLQALQDRILAQAVATVTNAQSMNAQGVITWDIEGEQYPQPTSYVCSPDQLATVAPEMESTVTDPSSAYFGQKLDDAYFKIMSSANLRLGLCIRPQAFTLEANGTASQITLSGNAAIIANLEKKARYANGRWGATVFYVDSTVDVNGGTLDPAIFQQLITDLPNFLFIPEESTTRYYAYSAPFYSFIDHASLGTPAVVRNTYPAAFGANLVNDAAASTLAQYTPQLTQAVAGGDILMGHADYWQANDPTFVAIYRAAGVTGPTRATPEISWAAPLPIVSGTPLSTTQLDATSNVAGSFTYTPALATVLSAGVYQLSARFTPADSNDYQTVTTTVMLTVTALTVNEGGGFVAGTMKLNGSAGLSGSRLRLTNGGSFHSGSAFYDSPLNIQAFNTSFMFQLTNPQADGITFLLQNQGVSALGGYGSALGYGGIVRSVAIKFDLHNNAGEGVDSTGLFVDGASPTTPATDLTSTGINLHSGDLFQAQISYDGATLTVLVTDMVTKATGTQHYTINIPSIVGGNTAFAGFSGATGGRTATQDIVSWTFLSNTE